jgi:hypothetical protein
MKVFWSWQDDSPGKANRQFIKEALEEAIKAIDGDFEFQDADRPSLDHDTKGVAGAKEIVPTIMTKIAASVVFVADVTPIAETDDGKALPNPNVMVELGWSLNKPGDGRQIYVLNTGGGWSIEGLPFDIRHRRVLTYSLTEADDKKTRDRALKLLTRDLTSAITANLTEHLDEKAQEMPAAGISAKEGEPSIWTGSETGFRHQDSFGNNHWTDVTIPDGPRAYLRVIPTAWKEGPPSVAQIGALGADIAPYARADYGSGDFGATREGYVRYWLSSQRDEPVASKNVSMYFEDTGEFWIIDGDCVVRQQPSNRRIVQLYEVFRGWSTALRRAHRVLDQYGALAARRIEVGFTGFDDVRFPGGWGEASQRPARRDAMRVDEIRRDWSEPAVREAFLVRALGGVFDLFGLDPLKSDAAAKFVRTNDPERPRDPPED